MCVRVRVCVCVCVCACVCGCVCACALANDCCCAMLVSHSAMRYVTHLKSIIFPLTPARDVAVLVSKATSTHRPSGYYHYCQEHVGSWGTAYKCKGCRCICGSCSGSCERQRFAGCSSVRQCCSDCCAIFAQAKPEERTNWCLERCGSAASDGRVSLHVGRATEIWKYVHMIAGFYGGLEELLHGSCSIQQQVRDHVQKCPRQYG